MLSLGGGGGGGADHEILIHDGASRSELIFVYVLQHVLISDKFTGKEKCDRLWDFGPYGGTWAKFGF